MNLIVVSARVLGIYLFTQAINALGLVLSMLIGNIPDFGNYVLPYLSSTVILILASLLLFLLPFGLDKFLSRHNPEITILSLDEPTLFRLGCKIVGLTIATLGTINFLTFLLNMTIGLGIHDEQIFGKSTREVYSGIVNLVSVAIGLILVFKSNSIVIFIEKSNRKGEEASTTDQISNT